MAEAAGHIVSLNIYPIKSCHAATVDDERPAALDVGMTGLEAYAVADHEFVIIEPPSGSEPALFVTQRGWGSNNRLDRSKQNDRKLAAVRTDISSSRIRVSAGEDFGAIELPTETTDVSDVAPCDVKIFGGSLRQALDQGDRAADFFSSFLDRTVRLVRKNPLQQRHLKTQYKRSDAVNVTAATDGYPMLLVNQTSLDFSHKTNGLKLGTVPIAQYRASLVINGITERPYDEDLWRKVRIGDVSAYIVKACQRCPIPNIDQQSGERGAGGQAALRGRLGYINDPDDKAVIFGQNINHVYIPGQQISEGDAVEVVTRSDERNFTLVQ